jgi:hypothetical protein
MIATLAAATTAEIRTVTAERSSTSGGAVNPGYSHTYAFQLDAFHEEAFQLDAFQDDAFHDDAFQLDAFHEDAFHDDAFQLDASGVNGHFGQAGSFRRGT